MLHVITDTSQIQLFDPRLTYNFYIKGGFSGGEDYRWAVIRIWYPGWRWELFNLVFICFLGPDAPCGHCSEDTVHVMFFQFCLLELHGVKLEVVIGWFLAVHYFDKCCIVAYRSILHFV